MEAAAPAAAAPAAGDDAGGARKILPFVDTLHYVGCGCPPSWQQGARIADQVDALVQRSHKMFMAKLISPNRPLRVCYMLPHHNITGGMKCLVEHVRLLRQRGHYTIAAHRSDYAQRAMPPWTSVEAGAYALLHACNGSSSSCLQPAFRCCCEGACRMLPLPRLLPPRLPPLSRVAALLQQCCNVAQCGCLSRCGLHSHSCCLQTPTWCATCTSA